MDTNRGRKTASEYASTRLIEQDSDNLEGGCPRTGEGSSNDGRMSALINVMTDDLLGAFQKWHFAGSHGKMIHHWDAMRFNGCHWRPQLTTAILLPFTAR